MTPSFFKNVAESWLKKQALLRTDVTHSLRDKILALLGFGDVEEIETVPVPTLPAVSTPTSSTATNQIPTAKS